jgi:hypothetical protein
MEAKRQLDARNMPNKRVKQEVSILGNQPPSISIQPPPIGSVLGTNIAPRTPQQFNMQQQRMNPMQCIYSLTSVQMPMSAPPNLNMTQTMMATPTQMSSLRSNARGNSPMLESVKKPSASRASASSKAANTPQQSEVELDLEGMMDVTNYAGVDLKV